MWWLSHAHHIAFCKVSARGLKIGPRFHKTLVSVTLQLALRDVMKVSCLA